MTAAYSILRRIVRNDAIKTDPPEIYNWRIFGLAAAACFGGTLFGVDTGIIGGVLVMPDFKREFGLEGVDPIVAANLSGNLVVTMQAGAILGALITTPVADIRGRKPAMLMFAVCAFIGGLLQALSYGHLACFFVGRFVEGLGLGASSMLAPTYVAENAPRATRGLMVGLFQQLLVIGGMTAYFINYGAALHLSGRASWMVPLAMQSLPPILLFVSILFCPESPRWLASKDNWDEATAVLTTVRQLPAEHPYVQQELNDMRKQLAEERQSVHGTGFWALQKECWLIPSNRKRALMCMAIMMASQLTGTSAINYYAPRIFTSLGLETGPNSLFATGMYGVAKVLTCIIFVLFLADTFGRRTLLVWNYFGLTVCMMYIGLFIRFDSPDPDAAHPKASGYVAILMVYLFATFFEWGPGPLAWVIASEMPKQRLRAFNVALSAAVQWLGSLIVSQITPIMLESIGYGTYLIYGSFCFIWAILAFWVPETKGVSLERMDELFGAADYSDVESKKQADEVAVEQQTVKLQTEKS